MEALNQIVHAAAFGLAAACAILAAAWVERKHEEEQQHDGE